MTIGRTALCRGGSICIPKCASRWANHFLNQIYFIWPPQPYSLQNHFVIFYSSGFPAYFKRLLFKVPETFILVPALLGLKGNLEMTLASRLSTFVSYRWIIAVIFYSFFFFLQANMGHLDSAQQRKEVISANLALIQVQATVVAFLASAFAIALAWIPKGQVSVCFFCENDVFFIKKRLTNDRNQNIYLKKSLPLSVGLVSCHSAMCLISCNCLHSFSLPQSTHVSSLFIFYLSQFITIIIFF